ncbi:MAG: hypothetical protein L0196_07165 [candidate division Zixibacteria bacterium]|nr:hypothetical protein [candidate division Zixibacteria bacterium]
MIKMVVRNGHNPDNLNRLANALGKDDPWVKMNLTDAARFPEIATDIEMMLSVAVDERGFDRANLPPYSLQSNGEVQDPIHIGETTWNDRKYNEFKLSLQSFFLPVLVVGGTGSGKSNLVKNCVSQLADYPDKTCFWIFDFLQEYRELATGHQNILVLPLSALRINPLRPPAGVETSEWAQVFTEIYSHSFHVLTGSKSFIHTSLHDLYAMYADEGKEAFPSLADFLQYLRAQKLTRTVWSYAPLNILRIDSICKSLVGKIDVSRGFEDELPGRNVVFEFDSAGESELQNFLCEYLMTRAFYSRRNTTSIAKNLVLIIDEGHRIFDRSKEHTAAGLPLIDTLVTQCRHAKISMLCSVQEISKTTNSLVANSHLKFVLQEGSGRDEDEVSKALQLTKEQKDCLPQLRVGEAIAATDAGLYLVKVKPFTQGSMVSEQNARESTRAAIDRLMQVVEGRSDLMKTRLAQVNGRGPDLELALLLCLAKSPLSTAGELAGALKSSRAKVDRGLDALEFKGLLRKVKPLNLFKGGGIILYEPTEKGKNRCKESGQPYYHPGKCGLEGYFYLTKVIEPFYRSQGYSTRLEGRSGNSTADLIVEKNDQCTAVELELTNANIYANLLRNLAATGVDQTVLVLKNNDLFQKATVMSKDLDDLNRRRIELRVITDFAPGKSFVTTKEIENENEIKKITKG